MICWKIRIFAYWTTPPTQHGVGSVELWFAEKFVSLLIEQHLHHRKQVSASRCDLLKNSYLCLLNNTLPLVSCSYLCVVICWKIRIFAYWTTPGGTFHHPNFLLWFAEKFVSLLIEQHPDYVEVAQYESVVSNDRNGKNPMLEGRDLNKREVSSFLLIYLHALSFSMKRRNWV